MKTVFLTDGSSRRVQVGKLQVILKRTTPRNMATAGRMSGLVIQALRSLGERQVDMRTVDVLRGRLNDTDKKQLIKDIRYAPAWIANVHAASRHSHGELIHGLLPGTSKGAATVGL